MENLNEKSITKKRKSKSTKYNPELHNHIAYLAALAGMSNVLLAKELNISRSTLVLWRREYKEFDEAIQRGKDEFDDFCVVKSLKKNAFGYDYKEIHEEFDKDGNLIRKKVIKKHQKPDTIAQLFWLKNRQRDKWKDRWEIDGLGDALKDGIKVKLIDAN
jgi:hypothetical protein